MSGTPGRGVMAGRPWSSTRPVPTWMVSDRRLVDLGGFGLTVAVIRSPPAAGILRSSTLRSLAPRKNASTGDDAKSGGLNARTR